MENLKVTTSLNNVISDAQNLLELPKTKSLSFALCNEEFSEADRVSLKNSANFDLMKDYLTDEFHETTDGEKKTLTNQQPHTGFLNYLSNIFKSGSLSKSQGKSQKSKSAVNLLTLTTLVKHNLQKLLK